MARSKLKPGRFGMFVGVLVVAVGSALWYWRSVEGVMAGFDVAAFAFLASCLSLLNDNSEQMRRHSRTNDANPALLLGISVTVTTVILLAVGAVIADSRQLRIADAALIIATLLLAWLFGNVVYTLHYAHMYYASSKRGGDAGGIAFPSTKEPNYWDFVYFGFTLGMTFQTSDCDITSQRIRRVSIGHCVAAFIFNLGVLAFTINALGGG
ncbi:putative membrane protein [Sphingomonas sp. F9_3S_D5_B_2]